MSSGIAAPNGGRFVRARAGDGARDHERRRMRRYLQVTTLRALENIAGSDADAGVLVAEAGDTATELRGFVLTADAPDYGSQRDQLLALAERYPETTDSAQKPA